MWWLNFFFKIGIPPPPPPPPLLRILAPENIDRWTTLKLVHCIKFYTTCISVDLANYKISMILPVCGFNLQALESELSPVQVDNHGITILYHLHRWIPCIASINVHLAHYQILITAPGFEVIKSCSTQLSTKYQLLIKTIIQTNKEFSCFKSLRCCSHVYTYEHAKFIAQLSWACKKVL